MWTQFMKIHGLKLLTKVVKWDFYTVTTATLKAR